MCGAIPLLSLGAFMAWKRKKKYLFLPLPQKRTMNFRSPKYKWQEKKKLRNNSFDYKFDICGSHGGNNEDVRPFEMCRRVVS